MTIFFNSSSSSHSSRVALLFGQVLLLGGNHGSGSSMRMADAQQQQQQNQIPDDCAHVVGVVMTATSVSGTYDFATSVASSETGDGWDKYANEWRIVDRDDNTIIYGTRDLGHPHVDEQPFTRELTNVVIPDMVTAITVEAQDSVLGYCGDVMTLMRDTTTNRTNGTGGWTAGPQTSRMTNGAAPVPIGVAPPPTLSPTTTNPTAVVVTASGSTTQAPTKPPTGMPQLLAPPSSSTTSVPPMTVPPRRTKAPIAMSPTTTPPAPVAAPTTSNSSSTTTSGSLPIVVDLVVVIATGVVAVVTFWCS